MKFQLAVNLERMDNSVDMENVKNHTLEMVKMVGIGKPCQKFRRGEAFGG